MKRPRRQRISPEEIAKIKCINKEDSKKLVKVKINDFIGYGVFAKENIEQKEYLCEYDGEKVSPGTINPDSDTSLMYFFNFKEKLRCIDGSKSERIGRYVNDSPPQFANCKMKTIVINKEPRLCLFALQNISMGTELRYDYGEDQPWRNDKKNIQPFVLSMDEIAKMNDEVDSVSHDHAKERNSGKEIHLKEKISVEENADSNSNVEMNEEEENGGSNVEMNEEVDSVLYDPPEEKKSVAENANSNVEMIVEEDSVSYDPPKVNNSVVENANSNVEINFGGALIPKDFCEEIGSIQSTNTSFVMERSILNDSGLNGDFPEFIDTDEEDENDSIGDILRDITKVSANVPAIDPLFISLMNDEVDSVSYGHTKEKNSVKKNADINVEEVDSVSYDPSKENNSVEENSRNNIEMNEEADFVSYKPPKENNLVAENPNNYIEEVDSVSYDTLKVNKSVKENADSNVEMNKEVDSVSYDPLKVNKPVEENADTNVEMNEEVDSVSYNPQKENNSVEESADNNVEMNEEVDSVSYNPLKENNSVEESADNNVEMNEEADSVSYNPPKESNSVEENADSNVEMNAEVDSVSYDPLKVNKSVEENADNNVENERVTLGVSKKRKHSSWNLKKFIKKKKNSPKKLIEKKETKDGTKKISLRSKKPVQYFSNDTSSDDDDDDSTYQPSDHAELEEDSDEESWTSSDEIVKSDKGKKEKSSSVTSNTVLKESNTLLSSVNKEKTSSSEKGSGKKERKETNGKKNLLTSPVDFNLQPSSAQEKENIKEIKEKKVIVNSCKKKNGKRVYDKEFPCFFCGKFYQKLPRHYDDMHYNDPIVKSLTALKPSKTDSEETKKQKQKMRNDRLDELRETAVRQHNQQVMSHGDGNLLVAKRPSEGTEKSQSDFLPCLHCYKFYFKDDLSRHIRSCPKKTDEKVTLSNRVQGCASMLFSNTENVSGDLQNIFKRFMVDDISDCVKTDPTIIAYGNSLCRQHSNNSRDQGKYIGNKLRELGRIVIEMRSLGKISTLKEIINPVHFPDILQSVLNLCDFNEMKKTVRVPSLGIKLGQLLQKVATMLEGKAIIERDEEMKAKAKDMRKLISMQWNTEIARVSRTELQNRKRNRTPLVPLSEDLMKLKEKINSVQSQSLENLKHADADVTQYRNLANSTLASIILFNRRREGEASQMLVTDTENIRNDHLNEEIKKSLSKFELKLCSALKRVEICGKHGRTVPVILTRVNEKSIKVLLDKRHHFVKEDNNYLFAVPSKDSPYWIRGNDAIRKFVAKCDLKSPEAISSTKLRKHIATLSQILNLEERELEMLANFLGHDIAIHREYYRLPDQTLQLAKCSKLLVMLDQGKCGEFIGKSLDEIDIDLEASDDENETEDTILEDEATTTPTTTTTTSTSTTAKSRVIEKVDKKRTEKEKTQSKKVKSKEVEPLELKENVDTTNETKTERRFWSEIEKEAVRKHMAVFFKLLKTPGKDDCLECLRKSGAVLKNRSWSEVKYFVYNTNVKTKRKMKSKQ